MHPSFEIDERVRGYLARREPLDALRRWFHAAAAALMELSPETRASEMATALQLALIEYEHGDFSENQLRRHLRKALNETFEVVVQNAPSLTTSANDTQPATGNAGESSQSPATILAFQLTPTGTAS